MGAGRGDVRSRGLEVRSESGVFRFFRDLGGSVLSAVPEAAAVAVHLQDVDVVGETVQQRLRSGAPSQTPRSTRRRAGWWSPGWSRARSAA